MLRKHYELVKPTGAGTVDDKMDRIQDDTIRDFDGICGVD
jgi:hypothetical protein